MYILVCIYVCLCVSVCVCVYWIGFSVTSYSKIHTYMWMCVWTHFFPIALFSFFFFHSLIFIQGKHLLTVLLHITTDESSKAKGPMEKVHFEAGESLIQDKSTRKHTSQWSKLLNSLYKKCIEKFKKKRNILTIGKVFQ